MHHLKPALGRYSKMVPTGGSQCGFPACRNETGSKSLSASFHPSLLYLGKRCALSDRQSRFLALTRCRTIQSRGFAMVTGRLILNGSCRSYSASRKPELASHCLQRDYLEKSPPRAHAVGVQSKVGPYAMRHDYRPQYGALILWWHSLSFLAELPETEVTVASDRGVCGDKSDPEHNGLAGWYPGRMHGDQGRR